MREIQPNRLTRARGMAGWGLIAFLILAWIAAGLTFLMPVEHQVRLIALAVAAGITELSLWIGAALLGLRLAETRSWVWSRLVAPFQRR